MHATFDHSQQESNNITTFWFQPAKPLRYTAGQFVELRLPHNNVDSRGDKRWFTLSSSPTDRLISITTKFSTQHHSSYKQQLKTLRPGDEVHLSEPMGDFVLPVQSSIPLVFVAGGIGITPMYSMVKWLEQTEQTRSIHLVYAAKTSQELVFQDLFLNTPITFTPMVQHPDKTWHGAVGSITSELIYQLPGVTENALIYISGPEQMVEQCTKELIARGIASHRIIGDYFPGYQSV